MPILKKFISVLSPILFYQLEFDSPRFVYLTEETGRRLHQYFTVSQYCDPQGLSSLRTSLLTVEWEVRNIIAWTKQAFKTELYGLNAAKSRRIKPALVSS